jgi:hypothetical protein
MMAAPSPRTNPLRDRSNGREACSASSLRGVVALMASKQATVIGEIGGSPRAARPVGPDDRPERLAPAGATQLAALAAGVTEATIRKWASRGKLTRYGRPGRAEYDLDEVFIVLRGVSGRKG